MFMEYLEEEAMDTALPDMRLKIWHRYIDDSFEVVRRDKRDELTRHLNTINKTWSMKFTDEPEKEGSISFLDTVISCKDDRGEGGMKVQVYRKVTHTDQYLAFGSHHPLNHKLGVLTLYNRCDNIVMEEADVAAEIIHVDKALGRCVLSKVVIQASGGEYGKKEAGRRNEKEERGG